MTKREFFDELNELLSDISSEEREEAIGFYENYFDDAGKENEEVILKELISPQKVAQSIKLSINSNEDDQENQGYFTETGYKNSISNLNKQEISVPERIKQEDTSNKEAQEDYNIDCKDSNSKGSQDTRSGYYDGGKSAGSQNYNDSKTYSNNGNYYSSGDNGEKPPRGKQNIITLILIGIVLVPLGLPVVLTILGFLFSVTITVISIWIAFLITSISMLVAGVILLGIGILQYFVISSLGFLFAGIGLILLGLGILFSLVTIKMAKSLFPFLYNGILRLVKLPFKNRRALA